MLGAVSFNYLPASQADVVRTDRCAAWVWQPAKGLLVTRVEGYFSEDAAALIDAKSRAVTARDSSICGMHDWEGVDDYATATRTRLTQMATEVKPMTTGNHILVGSPIVTLALQTANLVLRNVTAYKDRASWEKALAAMIHTKGPVSSRR